MPGRLCTTLLACVLAATLAGCGAGDDGTIPSGDAEELLAQLNELESDVQDGNCELAQQQATEFATVVSQLPGDVDPEVREGLAEASARLSELTQQPDQCETVTGATGEEGFQPTTTETTTTDEEEPTTTEEEEPTTTEEEEPPPEDGGDEPLQVPGEDDDDGGGRGGTESGGIEPEKGRQR